MTFKVRVSPDSFASLGRAYFEATQALDVEKGSLMSNWRYVIIDEILGVYRLYPTRDGDRLPAVYSGEWGRGIRVTVTPTNNAITVSMDAQHSAVVEYGRLATDIQEELWEIIAWVQLKLGIDDEIAAGKIAQKIIDNARDYGQEGHFIVTRAVNDPALTSRIEAELDTFLVDLVDRYLK